MGGRIHFIINKSFNPKQTKRAAGSGENGWKCVCVNGVTLDTPTLPPMSLVIPRAWLAPWEINQPTPRSPAEAASEPPGKHFKRLVLIEAADATAPKLREISGKSCFFPSLPTVGRMSRLNPGFSPFHTHTPQRSGKHASFFAQAGFCTGLVVHTKRREIQIATGGGGGGSYLLASAGRCPLPARALGPVRTATDPPKPSTVSASAAGGG